MSNNPKGITFHEQMDVDLANDDLDKIVEVIGDLKAVIEKITRLRESGTLNVDGLEIFKGGLDDAAADLFAADWFRLIEISGLGKHVWMPHIVESPRPLTNPATFNDIGKPL